MKESNHLNIFLFNGKTVKVIKLVMLINISHYM